jgi:hypothetical protein
MREAAAGNKFHTSYQKYRNNAKLGAGDLSTLLRKVRQTGDSPIPTKIADLQQQWESKKHRFDIFSIKNNNVDRTPNDDGTITSPNTPAHVQVVNVREQVQRENNFGVTANDGSGELFLDMLRKIISSTDKEHFATI